MVSREPERIQLTYRRLRAGKSLVANAHEKFAVPSAFIARFGESSLQQARRRSSSGRLPAG